MQMEEALSYSDTAVLCDRLSVRDYDLLFVYLHNGVYDFWVDIYKNGTLKQRTNREYNHPYPGIIRAIPFQYLARKCLSDSWVPFYEEWLF